MDARAAPRMTNVACRHCPISPLAPKTIPDMPAIAGVRLATAAAGIRYQGRTDVHARRLRRRHQRRRRVHALEMPFGAGRVVPRPDQGRPRPRAGRQFRQCQRLYRQERPRGLCASPPSSPRPPSAARRPKSSSPRPASSASRCRRKPLTASWRTSSPQRNARRLRRRRQGDHDHRHVPEARHRHARASAARR